MHLGELFWQFLYPSFHFLMCRITIFYHLALLDKVMFLMQGQSFHVQ